MNARPVNGPLFVDLTSPAPVDGASQSFDHKGVFLESTLSLWVRSRGGHFVVTTTGGHPVPLATLRGFAHTLGWLADTARAHFGAALPFRF